MSEVEQIVANVLSASKYRSVCPSTVRRFAGEEWTRHGTLKAAIKAVKSRLHQAYSAYESGIDYAQAYRALEAAYARGTDQDIRATCREILTHHASTRERLPILPHFYGRIFAHTGMPQTLLDLACGLNPLALPWMGLPGGAVIHAYDIDRERIAFLERFFSLAGVAGTAHLQDVICDPPTEPADVALLLKTGACLERQRRGSTLALLDALRVSFAVVTFPAHSLGRRDKGMPAHYTAAIGGILSDRPWPATRLELDGELVFIVDKR